MLNRGVFSEIYGCVSTGMLGMLCHAAPCRALSLGLGMHELLCCAMLLLHDMSLPFPSSALKTSTPELRCAPTTACDRSDRPVLRCNMCVQAKKPMCTMPVPQMVLTWPSKCTKHPSWCSRTGTGEAHISLNSASCTNLYSCRARLVTGDAVSQPRSAQLSPFTCVHLRLCVAGSLGMPGLKRI